jgi:two-component system, chemotaxis family, CheB/CheR fusion protein
MRLSGRRVDEAQLILVVIEDITENRRNEAHQNLLMQELNHRVKNALAVVQALASQTVANSASLEEFEIAFKGRLAALARGHSLLLQREWISADLVQLAQDVVNAIDPARVSVEGLHIELPPRKAISVYLTLHELLTNATKYGALSKNGGRIEIHWDMKDKSTIRLAWQENGGPRVAPPEREGFGTKLIRQIAEYELDGDCELHYEPEGLRCELAFPTGDGGAEGFSSPSARTP